MNTPKRLLIYVVSFITLNVFAFGLSSLVGWILDLIGIIGDSQPQNIAPFIAAIIVCFPIWLYFWKLSKRNVQDFPEEEFSSLRNLYLNFVNGLSVIIISISIFGFFNSILNFEVPFNYLPNLIVWIPILLLHLNPSQKNWEKGNKRIHEFFLNVVFITSIIVIFISSRGLIFDILDNLLILISSNDLIVGDAQEFEIGISVLSALATGFILLIYSWSLRIKKIDKNFRTIDLSVIAISQAFIFLLSIFALLTQSILLIFENNSNSSESIYLKLEYIPEYLSFTIVSLIIWLYYSSGFLPTKIKSFYTIRSKLIKWIYRYALRAISLVFLFSSSVSLLIFILGIPLVISEDVLISPERSWGLQFLSSSISALIIGLLTFKYINIKITKDLDENKHIVQKSYIYLIAIIFAFLLIGSLIAILTIIIRDLISWNFNLTTLELIRFPLSFAINSLIILFINKDDITSRLNSKSEENNEKKSIQVISLKSFEKIKENISDTYEVTSWRSFEDIKKFKASKKGLDELSNTVNSLENKNNDYFLAEDDNGDILLYYYKK
mgnify:FL=1